MRVRRDLAGDTQCFGYDHDRRLTEAWTRSGGNYATAANPSLLFAWYYDNSLANSTDAIGTTAGCAPLG